PGSLSVDGAEMVGKYFGEGWASPLTVVAELPADKLAADGTLNGEDDGEINGDAEGEKTDLNTTDGRYHIARLHAELYYIDVPSDGEEPADLGHAANSHHAVNSNNDADSGDDGSAAAEASRHRHVADVRSFYRPTGGDPRNRRILSGEALQEATAVGSPIAAGNFVSSAGEYDGRVTQLSVVLNADPFGQEARDYLPVLKAKLDAISRAETLPRKPDPRPGRSDILDEAPNPWRGARFELAGTTAGLYDLQQVTNADRTRIQICTVTAVFLVLVVLLRRPLACVYLIITVLLSYWATIGATEWFFQSLYGPSFHGLDWKVPIFLFVILIAVGQDYNIYLTTRVFEEQERYGLSAGLRRAIVQTGGIITSCGVIMAGTFVSMATGSLRAMVELGFSLAL
ncbi:MAG: MMPL family transporter, partial [Planctomycetota bacterium]